MNLEDELRNAQEELNYWIRRKTDGDSDSSQSQIEYFQNKIASLKREISETKYDALIPQDYVRNVAQTMAILVGRQLDANEIERINRHVSHIMGSKLKSLTQTQYQLLAAEVIPDYKTYLHSTGIYNEYKVDAIGKIVSYKSASGRWIEESPSL